MLFVYSASNLLLWEIVYEPRFMQKNHKAKFKFLILVFVSKRLFAICECFVKKCFVTHLYKHPHKVKYVSVRRGSLWTAVVKLLSAARNIERALQRQRVGGLQSVAPCLS